MKIVLSIVASIVALSMGSCAAFKKSAETQKEAIVYPAAPDTARLQYLTTINGSNFLGSRSKFSSYVMGKEEVQLINKPFGTYMRNGKLYICDPGNDGMVIMDMAKKRYTFFAPGGSGQMKTPLSCVVDSNDYLYVADPGMQYVLVFDSTLKYKARIKDTGNFKPSDIRIHGNELWVTNPGNHKINIYDKRTFEFIRYFSDYEQGDDGFLFQPYNFFIAQDRVYIADFGEFRIKVFDLNGKYLSAIGSYGTGLGQFVRPKGIACDRDCNLYVVDAGFENTQIFNKDGDLLMFFGGPYKGPGDMWLPSSVTVDYDNLKYFRKYLDPAFDLKYIVMVSNQYGPDKLNVYGAVEPKKK